jgi:hypothetical protein
MARGATVFRIRIELIFRRCWNLITPLRAAQRRGESESAAPALAQIGRHMTAGKPDPARVSPAGPAIGLSSSGSGQFDCGRITGLNRAAVGAYSLDGTKLVCTTINPRRVRLVAALCQGFDAPGNPRRT